MVLLVNGRRMVMALTVIGLLERESVMKLVGMTAEKVSNPLRRVRPRKEVWEDCRVVDRAAETWERDY